jgi:hypothetical protein
MVRKSKVDTIHALTPLVKAPTGIPGFDFFFGTKRVSKAARI